MASDNEDHGLIDHGEGDAEEEEEPSQMVNEEDEEKDGEPSRHDDEAEEGGEGEHDEFAAHANENYDEQEEVNESKENKSHDDEESEHDEKPIDTDNDSDEEFAGFGEEEFKASKKAKKRAILSDDDEEGEKEASEAEKDEEQTTQDENQDEEGEERKKKSHKKHKKDKSSKKSKKEKKNSDEEAEEGGGVDGAGEEVSEPKQSSDQEDEASLNESEVVPSSKKNKRETSEVDMLLKKKSTTTRRNRKKDSEEITDMDNKISMIIVEMKNVAAEDRAANEKNLTTLQKLKMMPTVMNMLKKSEYHATMIELGMLGAIAEWLAPLPDRSLPNIKIRELLIDALKDFGEINADYLKSSGIGKAVMFLYKHSKEIKSNKQKLEKLINSWARPIFNLDGNFKQLTKEERLERDMEHVKTLSKRNMEQPHSASVDDMLNANDKFKNKKMRRQEEAAGGNDDPSKFLRPGDPGFCPRARVPVPSSKDYIIRPKSNIENIEMAATSKKLKKPENRMDKHKKRFLELKNKAKTNRAVTMVAAGGR